MTKADLIQMLAHLPETAEIIIHPPQSQYRYFSIRGLSINSFEPAMDVDGSHFPATVILQGAE